MTAVMEETRDAAARPPTPLSPARRGGSARLRADLRLARRQVWRARGSSALVMMLVALPVLAMTGAAVFWQSHVPTPEQGATLELGRHESWIAVAGGPDPSRWQSADEPRFTGVDTDTTGRPTNPELPPPTDPSDLVPRSATAHEVLEGGAVHVQTQAGIGSTPVTVGPVWDPLFEGRYAILSGEPPTRDDEAMVSPGLLDRLGARVGDDVVVADAGTRFTIAGTMRQIDRSASDDMLFLPDAARALVPQGTVRWFVADWQPEFTELTTLNHAGFITYARDLVLSPPPGATVVGSASEAFVWQALVSGSIVAVFSGYLIVLLAGAAFAVAARRQQRSLAVAASVGATRSDVFRVVVLQGTVLGLAGGVVGAAAGIGLAAGALALTDDGVRGSFWGHWGVQIPWGLVVGILVFSVLVGTLSAVAPARAATRGDVLGALRGSRRPAELKPKRPLWGLGLTILGLAGTIAGALLIAALDAMADIDYSSPLRVVALFGILLGPLLFQIGILIAGHWTLAMIALGLSRLGLAPRIAGRDAAANPSRVVPAFAAIAACVFVASFALSMTAMTASASQRSYGWSGSLGAVAVQMWTQDSADADAYIRAAEDLLAPTQPVATGLVLAPGAVPWDTATDTASDPDFPVWSVATADTDCELCDPEAALTSGSLSIVDPDELETVLGTRIDAAILSAFRDGALLSVDRWGNYEDEGTAQVVQWTSAGMSSYNDALNAYYSGTASAASLPEPAAVHELPARTLRLERPPGMLQTVIAPQTARGLGIALAPQVMFAAYAEPASDELVDAIRASAEAVRIGEQGSLAVSVERGPDPIQPWLWLISGVAVVLVIGAGAICLSLARFERRPDDATLTAVGAGRGIRRRINAWQAAIVVGVGTSLGTAAGLIPSWGMSQTSQDYLRFADAPWPWLGILAVAVPVVMTIAGWLVAPRDPDLTRRTAIA
ncbi:FtsX-like permease family protein [Microbacterium terregens]|uniref:FtsX-like permease family protein n=1 Tax=Microbacterium terregens TaxID=69363 RepID=A0ABV5SZX1_9MICO